MPTGELLLCSRRWREHHTRAGGGHPDSPWSPPSSFPWIPVPIALPGRNHRPKLIVCVRVLASYPILKGTGSYVILKENVQAFSF